MRWRRLGQTAVATAAWLVIGGLWGLSNAPAAPATGSTQPQGPVQSKPEEEARHRVLLLGATIYGMVAAPSAAYEVPWQEPVLLGRGSGELERNFLIEIFRPIDREEFLRSHESP